MQMQSPHGQLSAAEDGPDGGRTWTLHVDWYTPECAHWLATCADFVSVLVVQFGVLRGGEFAPVQVNRAEFWDWDGTPCPNAPPLNLCCRSLSILSGRRLELRTDDFLGPYRTVEIDRLSLCAPSLSLDRFDPVNATDVNLNCRMEEETWSWAQRWDWMDALHVDAREGSAPPPADFGPPRLTSLTLKNLFLGHCTYPNLRWLQKLTLTGCSSDGLQPFAFLPNLVYLDVCGPDTVLDIGLGDCSESEVASAPPDLLQVLRLSECHLVGFGLFNGVREARLISLAPSYNSCVHLGSSIKFLTMLDCEATIDLPLHCPSLRVLACARSTLPLTPDHQTPCIQSVNVKYPVLPPRTNFLTLPHCVWKQAASISVRGVKNLAAPTNVIKAAKTAVKLIDIESFSGNSRVQSLIASATKELLIQSVQFNTEISVDAGKADKVTVSQCPRAIEVKALRASKVTVSGCDRVQNVSLPHMTDLEMLQLVQCPRLLDVGPTLRVRRDAQVTIAGCPELIVSMLVKAANSSFGCWGKEEVGGKRARRSEAPSICVAQSPLVKIARGGGCDEGCVIRDGMLWA